MKNDLPIANHLPLTACGAARLANLIAQGEVTAADAVEQHIARISQVNPGLNAMCVQRFDAARAEAMRADAIRASGAPLGLLHGVPVTIKECIDVEGMPSTFGLQSRASHQAQADDVHVARLRAAGAIPVAKTNVAQALFFYEADNPVYGRTLNPWNAQRTPGGSSGGEAALIAMGASPLGLGTDIGGSVRVPAAFCGIASMKPTAGRCDDMGRFSAPLGQRAIASQMGTLARSVEDVALGLKVIDGGIKPLGDWQSVDVKGLRVAFYTDDGVFSPAPAVARAVREAADALRAAGAHVTPWAPPDTKAALDLVYGIYFADGLELLRERMGKGRRMPQMAQLEALQRIPSFAKPLLRTIMHAAGQHSMAEGMAPFGHRDTAHYWRLVEQQIDYRECFARLLDTSAGGPFDIVLCPPCALPAFTHGASKDLATAGTYACLFNLLGWPAGVVPFTRVRPGEEVGRVRSRDSVQNKALEVEEGSAGLPVGVQVVARPWMDHVALAAMAAIERRA